MSNGNAAQEPEFESALYRGRVGHRRHGGAAHEFSFPLHMMLLKLDELPTLMRQFWQLGTERWRWARFRRQDYLGDSAVPLDEAVREKMAALGGRPQAAFAGEIFLLCQLRYLGVYFSPLNLYFLRQDGVFTSMLAEVSNTPWNQRHYYLVDVDAPRSHPKAFHVSPFNPMDQVYHWRIRPPDPRSGDCHIHIRVDADKPDPVTVFDASLSLQRQELNQRQLTRVLARAPAQTLSILAGIYWQAFRLWLKKAKIHRHPDSGLPHKEKGGI